ncbi:MAG: T9SS C-terminal target domain-containing protein [Haliscomenobacteraceae bacterium CHB4]|nr:T9SS C-terminal target domain-containing protein [Haliscomenobacteraceae bacterium CHB4]
MQSKGMAPPCFYGAFLQRGELQSPLQSICLYDAGGNLIHHFPIPPNGQQSTWVEQRLIFPSSIAPGYYFLNVRTERGNVAVKIVKL